VEFPIKFSLVIPFGGDPEFLVKTVESVFEQTYDFWDLTIIDDGTNIDLKNILGIYLDRISIIFLPEKVGIVAIFDLAIEKLRGEIGMILGADDLLESNFLLEMAKAWKEFPEVTLIHPRVLTINEKSSIEIGFVDRFKQIIAPTNFRNIISGRTLIYSLLAGNWMYFTSSTFRIDKLKLYRFSPELQIAMDWELALRFSLDGDAFGYCEESIFFYRRHKNSFSMRDETARLRLKEEMQVVKTSGNVAKEKGQFDVWLFSKLHSYSYLNFTLRKMSSYKNFRISK